ncbi:glycosyltransferase family 4 protein [Clostridium gasigenes]|uniref:glycosyltransferase family 4 protein n=1 Tax=Clostridium gasigenes TaxID=94869 RepID=UPI001C0DF6BB|nr:glycosyltransferase family 4 protein [Clostridium gasigenes]
MNLNKYRLEESTKTTLLFVSWRDIKSPNKGGAEVYTHEMLKRIDFDKYRIIHFSPSFHCGKENENIDNINYIRSGNIFSVIMDARKYYIMNRENIDFVVDQCNTHRFFTRFWVESKKRIFFIHQLTREIWFMNAKFPISIMGYVTETPFLKLSKNDYTMTVSESTKRDLIKVGFHVDKVKIIPEGIEFSHWKKEEFKKKEVAPTFIYVGRFVNYKGIDACVLAFAKIKKEYPESKLYIVGKKNEKYIEENLLPIFNKENITYDSKDENSDVTLFGFVSEETKLELMSRSHALIFPSQREGWGLIVTEAAAVGTPSIVYNSPGIVDAVDYGKAGYLCSENTVENIYIQMKRVIEDKKEYENYLIKAYEYSLKFHWDKTAKSFDEFVNDIISNR